MKNKTNQHGIAQVAVVAIIVMAAIIGVVGWRVLITPRKDHKSTADTPATTSTVQTNYINIKDWGVRFPLVKSGLYSYGLPNTGQGSTPELTTGGPADMTSVSLNVRGFTKNDNKCVETDGSVMGMASIYRHKEQNPTIQYTTTFQLNAKVQVKIGDWYYSTKGLFTDGNCFEGIPAIPSDYAKLVNIFDENFKNLEKY